MSQDRDEIARRFAAICARASVPVMEVYAQPFSAEEKADRSPVTEADERAEALILEALDRDFPGMPVLAEESFSAGLRPETAGDFILVDPVDGTKEFINKNGEFTINIALVSGRQPIVGCVYAPALERIYLGGAAAWAGGLEPGSRFDLRALAPISTREPVGQGKIAVMSRSHADEKTRDFARRQGVTDMVSAGSSLKFCLVAEGKADIYPRFGPTKEWDTGAGQAVLEAAGGRVTGPDGEAFLYGKAECDYLNGPFVAWAR